MFTGIVTAVGHVGDVEARSSGARLRIGRLAGWDVREGESIAVSGVCLTAFPEHASLAFDVSPETLSRTTLGRLARAGRVNLERALAATDRFGGHMVAGHVDATTEVIGVARTGDFWTFTFALDPSWARYVVEKGSIALDGVSLTVATLRTTSFDVAVIPHTFHETTLGALGSGDRVNVEVDVLGKYVERILGARLGEASAGAAARDERLRDLLAEGA